MIPVMRVSYMSLCTVIYSMFLLVLLLHAHYKAREGDTVKKVGVHTGLRTDGLPFITFPYFI